MAPTRVADLSIDELLALIDARTQRRGTADDAMLVTLTAGELRQLIREEVASARPADFVDGAEVARLLQVKPTTIPTLVKREGLPAVRVGRQYRFRVPDVIAWAEERAVRPHGHHKRHAAVVRGIRDRDLR